MSSAKVERKQDLQRYDKHLKSKLNKYIQKFEEDDSRSTIGSHSELYVSNIPIGDKLKDNQLEGRIKRSYRNTSNIEIKGWTPLNQSSKSNAKKSIVKDKNNNSFVDIASFNIGHDKGYGNNFKLTRSSSKKLLTNKNTSSIGNLFNYEWILLL